MTPRNSGSSSCSSGKHASTIAKRRAKGYGIISDILLILDQIYDSERRIKIGLELQQAWFVNAMLVNVEVWHNVLKKKDIKVFIKKDNYLVRKIIDSHSKVPKELLFLETGAIPLEYILASRRLNYLHTIVTRDDKQLTKRIYNAQKHDPTKGDWIHHINEDKELLEFTMDEDEIKSTTSKEFKHIVKKSVRNAVLGSLKEIQSGHTKGSTIQYDKLATQPYLNSSCFSKQERSTLFNLRAETQNGFKACFSSIYKKTT